MGGMGNRLISRGMLIGRFIDWGMTTFWILFVISVFGNLGMVGLGLVM